MTLDHLIAYITDRFPAFLSALPVACAVLLGGLLVNFITGRALLLLARRTSLTELEVQPVRRLARWAIILLTLLLVAGVFGFQLGGLWAFLSTVLAMVAIGFVAVWSLLSHTSATLLLLFTRPFQIGDWLELKSEDVQGRLVDLNFFFATLQVDAHTTHQVPVNLFFQKVVRRVAGPYHHSLAQQLSADRPADLPPFPFSTGARGNATGIPPLPASEDAAMKAVPDPATLMPKR